MSTQVVYFTTLFPYIVLLALLINNVRLPGAVDGIVFYLTPKWQNWLTSKWVEKITESYDFAEVQVLHRNVFVISLTPRSFKQVWIDATAQVFYSIGVGLGVMVSLASHNKFNNNMLRYGVECGFVQ